MSAIKIVQFFVNTCTDNCVFRIKMLSTDLGTLPTEILMALVQKVECFQGAHWEVAQVATVLVDLEAVL